MPKKYKKYRPQSSFGGFLVPSGFSNPQDSRRWQPVQRRTIPANPQAFQEDRPPGHREDRPRPPNRANMFRDYLRSSSTCPGQAEINAMARETLSSHGFTMSTSQRGRNP